MINDNFINLNTREVGSENVGKFTKEKFNEYMLSGNYETYLVSYRGNLAESLSKLDYADAYITERFFAVVYLKNGMLGQFLKDVPEITLIEPNYPHTLSELSKNDKEVYTTISKGDLTFDGEGVIVGIIGTGIDYMNPRFITETGESRIITYWDQTLQSGPTPTVVVFGTEYTKDDITSIIKAQSVNNLSDKPMPSKDENGFGTALAGIIGGRNLGTNDIFSSIAPKCEFAIVNLERATESYLEFIGVDEDFKNVYLTSRLVAALRYLSFVQCSFYLQRLLPF